MELTGRPTPLEVVNSIDVPPIWGTPTYVNIAVGLKFGNEGYFL